jgi:HlyD family secretion protein
MFRKYILPVLAVCGFLFALWIVIQGSKPIPPAKSIAEPPRPPYEKKISGAGVVEASSRNIEIGTHVSGIVSELYVAVGKKVKRGDPLFLVDDRQKRAELAVREAALAEARAKVARLLQAPRKEELPPARAEVKAVQAILEDLRAQLRLAESISDRRAISIEDLNKRRYAVDAAEARLVKAKADLALLEAGSWEADRNVALAEVAMREAELQAAKVEVERLTVRAPLGGEILQVNLRPGEFAQSGRLAPPLILLGNLERLHVRVDIDENDAWRFRPQSEAVAFVRGNPRLKAKLTYEYVEPYVVPKRSLTGDSVERVDTRVMQVLYSFKRGDLPIYPGQLMDVYIESAQGTPGPPADLVPKEKRP